MGIFEAFKSKYEQQRQENFDTLEQASKIYDQQKQSISAIKNTSGFKEIVRYWQEEKRLAEEELLRKPRSVDLCLERFANAKRFLTFLERLVD